MIPKRFCNYVLNTLAFLMTFELSEKFFFDLLSTDVPSNIRPQFETQRQLYLKDIYYFKQSLPFIDSQQALRLQPKMSKILAYFSLISSAMCVRSEGFAQYVNQSHRLIQWSFCLKFSYQTSQSQKGTSQKTPLTYQELSMIDGRQLHT